MTTKATTQPGAAEEKNEIVLFVEKDEIEKSTRTTLIEGFEKFLIQAKDWKIKVDALVINDVTETDKMKEARIARLALKDIRVNADKTRKALKKDAISYGKMVEGVYSIIEGIVAPMEKTLEEKENYIELHEAKQRAAAKEVRMKELEPYAAFVPMGVDLGSIDEESYKMLFNGAKLQHEAKINADLKAAQDKEENERLLKIHRERRNSVSDVWAFFPAEWKEENFAEIVPEKWDELVATATQVKADHEAEQERTRLENERLKKEAAELQAEQLRKQTLQAERLKIILPYNSYGEIVDMTTLSDLSKEDFENTLFRKMEAFKEAAAEKKRLDEVAAQEKATADAALKKAKEEADKNAAELKAKQEAEQRAEQEKKDALEAELSKGDEEKFDALLAELEAIKTRYSFKSEKYNDLYKSVGEGIDSILYIHKD